MQHNRHTRLAFLFAVSVMTGLVTLVACSTDNGVVPLPGGGSSGNQTSSGNSSNGGTDDDDATGDDDTAGDDDDDSVDAGGADCAAAPRLRKTDKGFFCSFLFNPDAAAATGGNSNCPHETVCCNTSKKKEDGTTFFPTFCAPNGDPGNGLDTCAAADQDFDSEFEPGTAWECGSASNCPDDLKCCATSFDGADAGNYVNVGFIPQSEDDAPPKACNAKKFFKLKGTKCAKSCEDKKEIELCSETDKCSGDLKCYPARGTKAGKFYRELGACLK